MTMLDRMRRHKAWLKWSLALVVLAFIIFYIPAFLRPADVAFSTDVVATVEGNDITVAEYRRLYQAQIQAYRSAYGGSVNESLLKQLGIDQQILQQMVDERAALIEARRHGFTVTDAEVAHRIVTMPAFQEYGIFIGESRYRQLLSMQRPPVSPSEFEDSLRRSIAIDKLRAALTSWVTVSDDEVAREYQRRNEKVKAEVVVVAPDAFRPQVTVTDADLAQYFEAHKANYRVGEKRRIRYLAIDVEAIRAKVQVPSRDIERSYNDNIDLYSTPEQVRASHILFKTEGKKEEEVRAAAEKVLKEVQAGKDFAALAKQYSEDEQSAKQGGDLDYFAKGRMVPEFDAVAFEMAPGTTSGLVKSQYGFHIIRVVDKKAATTKPIEEVREQIVDQLAYEIAQTRAGDLAARLEGEIRKPADLDAAAQANGLKVEEAPAFARDEPILGLGPSPEAASTAFKLADGQVSGSVRVPRGFVFLTVTAKQEPYTPKLDEVKGRVNDDLVKERAAALATQRAAALVATFRTAKDLAKAVKDAGLELRTTELVARDTAWPDVGASQEVDRAAFALEVGAISEPIATDRGTVILRVAEHRRPTPEELNADRETLRTELLNDARNRFFSAYMAKAKQKLAISVSRENLRKVIG